jgi:hypothetical protein
VTKLLKTGTLVEWYRNDHTGASIRVTGSIIEVLKAGVPVQHPKFVGKTRKMATYVLTGDNDRIYWLRTTQVKPLAKETPSNVTYTAQNFFTVSLFSGSPAFEQAIRDAQIMRGRAPVEDVNGITHFFSISDSVKVRRVLDSLNAEAQNDNRKYDATQTMSQVLGSEVVRSSRRQGAE